MGRAYSRLQAALDAVGARLKRDRKHLVYELPNGRNFVVAKSPSDTRGEANALSDLRVVAGVDVEERRKASPEVRAERRRRPGRADDSPWSRIESPLAAAMKETGVANIAFEPRIERVERWVAEYGTQLRVMEQRVDRLESCWLVRLAVRSAQLFDAVARCSTNQAEPPTRDA